MVQKRTLVKSEAGVRLERVEEMAARQRSVMFKLSTYRPPQPRVFADEREANRAFAQEVKASMQDPVVVALIERGAI